MGSAFEAALTLDLTRLGHVATWLSPSQLYSAGQYESGVTLAHAVAASYTFFKAGEVIYDEGDEGTSTLILRSLSPVDTLLTRCCAGAVTPMQSSSPNSPSKLNMRSNIFSSAGIRYGPEAGIPRVQRRRREAERELDIGRTCRPWVARSWC